MKFTLEKKTLTYSLLILLTLSLTAAATFVQTNLLHAETLAGAGDLDTTFNGSGYSTALLGDSEETINATAIQSDGKIVVAGYAWNGANHDFALARYNTNGSLDTSFDADGKVLTPIGQLNDVAYAVAIQADGKILAAGSSNSTATKSNFAVVRYNADGSLDATFDTDGKLTTQIGAAGDGAYSVLIQSNNKIVAAGISGSGNFAAARYNVDGSLDITFDTDGKVTTAMGSSNISQISAALQTDGKIVLAGNSSNGSNYDFGLLRYNTDGSLDTSFDIDGKVITAIGPSNDSAYSVAIQSDGKIVAVGSSSPVINTDDFAVVR